MQINIKIFGQLTELIGANELLLQDVENTDLLKEKLILNFPKLANFPFVIAVNKKIVQQNENIKTGDVLALMPPFAGG